VYLPLTNRPVRKRRSPPEGWVVCGVGIPTLLKRILLLLEKIPLLLILLQWILLMLERTLLLLEGIPISRGIVLSWVEPGSSLPDSDEGLERVLVGMLWWHWGFRSMTMARHWDSSVIVWRSGALTVHIVRIKVWRLVLLLVWLSLERIL
jgi:hypothetical protein